MIKRIGVITIVICFILFSISCVSADNNNLNSSNLDHIKSENTAVDIDENQLLSIQNINTDNTEVLADYKGFDDLNKLITESTDEINLEDDYKISNDEVFIEKKNKFILNGNNHVIDGMDDEFFGFYCESNDTIIVKDIIFQNFVDSPFMSDNPIIFKNVTFINCTSRNNMCLIYFGASIEFDGCTFKDNNVNNSLINNFEEESEIILKNTIVSGGYVGNGVIYSNRIHTLVENCTFENLSSQLGSAINYKGRNLTVKNTKFYNLNASKSGGAIIAKFFQKNGDTGEPFLIENCEFINITTGNDGAIYYDMESGSKFLPTSLNIINTNFKNCKSRYGGAISDLGGTVNIANCTFENNYAGFEGGAIYTSWSNLNISNTLLVNNKAQKNAGAIYFDKGMLTLSKSKMTNNSIINEYENSGNVIYAYDADIDFSDSLFDNGGVSVYADFLSNSKLVNITKNNDVFSLDNKNYVVSIENNGIKLNLTNKTDLVDEIPSKYNLQDYGWVSPEKIQGDNEDCWAFATVASMESALLKSTGVFYNLSQNYVQKLQLKYFRNGDLRISSTGFAYSGLGYALSWYGTLLMDDIYDSRGMLVDTDLSDSRIHLQDAMIIFGNDNNRTNLIKEAILKYGSVTVHLYFEDSEDILTTGENISLFSHGIHFISLIGWDDNLNIGNSTGAWICKDSTLYFKNISYNAPELLFIDEYGIIPQCAAIAYIFENNINYHVNYQTDLTALTGFDGNYSQYSNEFTSLYDEKIGAVGTYFNESGIEYSFDIYINGDKVHTQSGVSEFAGFRTIILDKYVPIYANDTFKVVFKNNALPYQAYSRQHYVSGMSFVSNNGDSWIDLSTLNKTVCLKVYTVNESIEKRETTINVTTINDIINNIQVAISVTDSQTGNIIVNAPIKITIPNEKTIITNTGHNGTKTEKIMLPTGFNNITIEYTGSNKYNNALKIHNINVKNSPIQITITQMKTKLNNSKSSTRQVTSINGKNSNYITHKILIKNKILFIGNDMTIQTLNNIFDMDFTNGILIIYLDGKLVFNGTILSDDFTLVILENIENLIGEHELKVEFTKANSKTSIYSDNITIQ